MQVIVDGLLVNYRKAGKGRAVLFLHGWGEPSKRLEPLLEVLSKNYTVYAPDLPGFGGSQTPTDIWGLEEYAKFTHDFIKKVGAGELAVIIGHSNGGAMAVVGLSRKILKADKLVLIASAGIRDVKNARKRTLKLLAKTGKIATVPLPRVAKKRIRTRFYKAVGSDLTLKPTLEASFRKVVGEDIRLDAKRLGLPTLLIYGDRDKTTPVNFGRMLNESISGSRLEVVKGAGHFLHLNQAQQIAAIINDFLKPESKNA